MENITQHIIKFIKSDPHLNKVFYSFNSNRKYNIELFIDIIVYILKYGVSFRGVIKLINIYSYHNNNYNIILPHYTTIHKFSNKLFNYNVINLMYENLVNKYIKKNKCNKFLMDTTFISNKMGIDNISYNKCYPKHKLSKLSLITYIKGIPLNIYLDKGSVNNAKIIIKQLELFNNNKFINHDLNNIFAKKINHRKNNLFYA